MLLRFVPLFRSAEGHHGRTNRRPKGQRFIKNRIGGRSYSPRLYIFYEMSPRNRCHFITKSCRTSCCLASSNELSRHRYTAILRRRTRTAVSSNREKYCWKCLFNTSLNPAHSCSKTIGSQREHSNDRKSRVVQVTFDEIRDAAFDQETTTSSFGNRFSKA